MLTETLESPTDLPLVTLLPKSTVAEPTVAQPNVGVVPASLRVLKRHDELASLTADWRELAATTAPPTGQYCWSAACVATLAAQRPLRIVTLWANGKLTALAPLAIKRVWGIGRQVLLGVGELHEPMDFVTRDQPALKALTKILLRSGRPLWLERLPADSPTLTTLAEACRGRAWLVKRPQANCPFIDLDASWLEPEQHLNAGRRSDLRRARRKAEQLGELTTEIHTPRPETLDALFEEAIAIEAKSWKGAAGTALAFDARRAEFFRRYIQEAAADGSVRICFLRIAGQAVAMQIAVEQSGGFWLLKVGYDAEFSNCSPGLLLMRDTIRHAVERGLARYEFLGRAEAWTAVWTQTESATLAVRVYPYTLRGAAALAADGAAMLLAKARAALARRLAERRVAAGSAS